MIKYFSLFIMVSLWCPYHVFADLYTFTGGPAGGTFTVIASAVAELSKKEKINIETLSSQGSIDNIKKINTGRSHFGVAYSGDIFHGRNGLLKRDTRRYTRVMAVSFLFSAPAQLIVRADDNIVSAKQLAGKRVGVGNFGSGAAGNCELFFKEIDLWDQVNVQFLGYREASLDFIGGALDAFWLFTGFPNSSAKHAAENTAISLINVYNDANQANMFKRYPYFTKVEIPGGTYKGVPQPTVSFQDSAVLVVNERVPEEVVYKMLSLVFSPEGLQFMKKAHSSMAAMSLQTGLDGIVTPLHSGAKRFWLEKGMKVQ